MFTTINVHVPVGHVRMNGPNVSLSPFSQIKNSNFKEYFNTFTVSPTLFFILLFVTCVSYRVAEHWWRYLVDTQQPMDSDMAVKHPNIAKNTLSSLKQIEYGEIRFVISNQFFLNLLSIRLLIGGHAVAPQFLHLLSSPVPPRPVPLHSTSSFHSRPLSHIGPSIEMVFCCCQYKWYWIEL